MKHLLLLFCITISISQLAFAQAPRYLVELDAASKNLIVLKFTDDPAKGDTIQGKGGIPIEEGDIIQIPSKLTGKEFPIANWKIEVQYDESKSLHSNFTDKPYDIVYAKEGIKFETQGGDTTDDLKNNITINLVDDKGNPQDSIKFTVPESKIEKAKFIVETKFIVDLDNLQSCKDDYLTGLSHTQADANLMVFSASGPSNDPPGKIEVFRNYKMSNDEELSKNDEKLPKGVYKGKGDFKFRKGTQLGVFSTDYNILNYKVIISSEGSNYNFENTNLISTLQGKLEGVIEAAKEVGSVPEVDEGAEDDKVNKLMELYRTISNDIIELQTKAIIDYCMLSDYFLKIRSEMTANEIPVSLSQFSAYCDIDQPEDIKNELNNLVKLYTELFTFATPPAPVFPTIVPNKDYHQLNLLVKTVKDNQTINTPDPINAIIVGGWRHSISGNFLLHRLLDEKYFLTDGEIMEEEDGSFVTKKNINRITDENSSVFAAGAQFNLYNQVGKVIGLGPSIGLASDIFSGKIDRLRFTTGVNFLMTTSIGRFGLTGGIAWGNVSKLENGYQAVTDDNNVSYVLESNEIPIREVWMNSGFIGITYALPEAME